MARKRAVALRLIAGGPASREVGAPVCTPERWRERAGAEGPELAAALHRSAS